jgi:uroporphyrinogen-III synthase
VFQVPIYRWALPEDLTPLRRTLDRVIAGDAQILLITNAAQVEHAMQILRQDGKVEPFREALRSMIVGSIGPTASERLRQYDWPIDLEPSHPKMGVLIKEAAERAPSILQSKRTAPNRQAQREAR